MYYNRSGTEGRPQSPQDWMILLGFALFIVAMVAAEIIWNYQPIKLAIPFVLGFWAILLVTHEAGHALAARWLDCRVERIVLGMGKPLGGFRVAGIPVEVRMFPIEGFVRFDAGRLRYPRWGKAFIYFAGPGTDLLLGLIAFKMGGGTELFQRSDDYGIILWQSFVMASLAQGILNLVPHGVATPQGEVPNDGLGILRSLFGRSVPLNRTSAEDADPSSPTFPSHRDHDAYDPADWWKRR